MVKNPHVLIIDAGITGLLLAPLAGHLRGVSLASGFQLCLCLWFAAESRDLRQSQMYFNRQVKLIENLHGSLCADQDTDTNTMLPPMANSDFVCMVHGQVILLLYIEHAD